MDTGVSNKPARIRELNDSFRRTFVGGVIHITQGVEALRPEIKAEVLERVRQFERFTKDNDPHDEHDLGSFVIGSSGFMWKIDYYDRDMAHGSEDPDDPDKTTRVLTVMLQEEY